MYELVYEHKDFIVVSKNPGVSFHRTAKSEGLCIFIKKRENLDVLFPVHRLDRITSGLLIFAKNKEAAKRISDLFQNREIEKYYLSISDKKPGKSQGLISGDMQKSRRGAWKLLRSKKNPAKTRFFSKAFGDGLRLFILKPLTGKTHQLRVALKCIGSPVLGDPLYYRGGSREHNRGYLHAYALQFSYLGELLCFVDKPCKGTLFNSKAFDLVYKEFNSPWLLKWPGS